MHSHRFTVLLLETHDTPSRLFVLVYVGRDDGLLLSVS